MLHHALLQSSEWVRFLVSFFREHNSPVLKLIKYHPRQASKKPMEFSVSYVRLISALFVAAMVLIMPVHGQISTGCTPSMITSFTPCLNFVTNSTVNGTSLSPTSDCCNALSSITSNSTNCMCLLVTGNIPFQIPINRTLAISLPRACNMPGVPLQCKASTPAPTFSPAAAPTPTATIPTSTPPAQTPESNTPQVQTPTSSTTPTTTTTTGSRPVLTPSAAITSSSFSPSLMLLLAGILIMKLN